MTTKARLLALSLTLVAQGCLSGSELCARCEPGGCAAGTTCQPAVGGAVCAPPGEAVSVCGVLLADAGAPDAGEPDAGEPDAGEPDAGPAPDSGTRCPKTDPLGLEWVESDPAGLCFTRTEVTIRQFEHCVTSTCTGQTYNPYLENSFEDCGFGKPGWRDHPMNCVDERGAADFCAFAGARLPTVDEWVAEASASDARLYPWGDDTPSCELCVMWGEFAGCGTGDTLETCTRPQGNSVSGLCDMAGNVWELTSDTNQSGSPLRCGGGFSTSDVGLLSVESCAPTGGYQNYVGFRCVRPFD